MCVSLVSSLFKTWCNFQAYKWLFFLGPGDKRKGKK